MLHHGNIKSMMVFQVLFSCAVLLADAPLRPVSFSFSLPAPSFLKCQLARLGHYDQELKGDAFLLNMTRLFFQSSSLFFHTSSYDLCV